MTDIMREQHQTGNQVSFFELSHKPAWSFAEFSAMAGVPVSSMQQILDVHEAPLFKIGRRLFILREDAIEWIQEMARNNPAPNVKRRYSLRKKGA